MSFIAGKSSSLARAVAAGALGLLLAATAGAASQPAPRLSGLKARVAQGVRVDLAASSLTAAELATLRPNVEKLKPRARTNAE